MTIYYSNNSNTMSIIPIDFSNINHKKIIMKLCKRNKFYEDDIYTEIYREIPPKIMKQLMMLGNDANTKMNGFLRETYENVVSYGYFMIDKQESRNAVVGFSIYNIENTRIRSELMFVMVDKDYQNRGFGTSLIKHYLNMIDNEKLFSRVKCDKTDDLIIKWYEKNGYKNYLNITLDGGRTGLMALFYNLPENYLSLNRDLI